ncbi:cation:dicarboxylate symporter family transporter [Burkholderia sp. MR1-5-21]
MENAGCQKQVVGFVLPAGLSFNLDGSSIYFVMAVVFVAPACNVPVTFGQELSLILIFMLTSKGIASVAGAGFVALACTLSMYHEVPLAGIVLLLGVDRFMDSMRTVTNLTGNALVTLVIAKWESARDDEGMRRAFEGESERN